MNANPQISNAARIESASKPSNAPSGIAQQLRKSVDVGAEKKSQSQAESMNIDDLIFPSSVASPAGISPSPGAEKMASEHATAPAIAIKRPTKADEEDI